VPFADVVDRRSLRGTGPENDTCTPAIASPLCGKYGTASISREVFPMHPLLTASLYLVPGVLLLVCLCRTDPEPTRSRHARGLVALAMISLVIILFWPALLCPLGVAAWHEVRKCRRPSRMDGGPVVRAGFPGGRLRIEDRATPSP
jgi:hypothetical protein